MRRIFKDFKKKPMSLVSTRRFYLEALAGVQAVGSWTDQASNLYSGNPIKQALDLIYNEKCAFCELLPLGSPTQVEHFRPKKGVAGMNHTGYYWLGYEWSNLLLSCGNCNTNKGNKFPINVVTARVFTPTIVNGIINEHSNFILNNPLLLEKHLLLNPEIDDPNKHIKYDRNGKLDRITIRGRTTIDICKLNRDELYLNGRKKIVDEIFSKLFKRLDRYNSGERSASFVILDIEDIINDEIIGPIIDEKSFTNFYKTILLNFDKFFINHFVNAKDRVILKMAYNKAIR